jgi:aspartate kinase
MTGLKVCKFGGSSLADAAQFRKVRAILESEPARRVAVCSAPGKSAAHPEKVTDLLLACAREAAAGRPFDALWEKIAGRYREIARELALKTPVEELLAEARRAVPVSSDAAASRGEWLSGRLLADFLGWDFVEAAGTVAFKADGTFDPDATQARLSAALARVERAVLPGFYGARPDGTLQVFSRGGSDVSGALAARAAGAAVYENWTDVSGLRMTDPALVPGAERIETITYKELRELSYMGATVLHEEALFPVRAAGIPVELRTTNRPGDPGTWIVADAPPTGRHGGLSGIAGRKGFTVIAMEKALMNQEVGFGRKVLEVLARHGVSYEHTPTGIDSMSVVASSAALGGRLEAILADLRAECRPDEIEVLPGMALVAVVGRGLRSRPGVAAKVFGALSAAGLNVRMIDQGASEMNIILGVEETDFEKSVRAVYEAFVKC